MLRCDRICVWLFILGMITLIPGVNLIKFIDELLMAGFIAVAILDGITNGNLRRYKAMWITLGIMAFYVIYSVTAVSYNTFQYVLMDAVIELKPFIPFLVVIAIRPQFTARDKSLLRIICIVNAIIAAVVLILGRPAIKAVFNVRAIAGITIYLSMMAYFFCSIDSKGKISAKSLLIGFILLAFGLICTRSKYYGEFILAVFFFFIYKPGMLSHVRLKHIFVIIALFCITLAATWGKINYYFVSGVQASVEDSESLNEFARPALYAGAGMIIADHPLFGSGLASFATYPSSVNYSGAYAEYGLDNVYGLSEEAPDFVCDAYYASLAQYGLAGIAFFIAFYAYAYGFLRKDLRHGDTAGLNRFRIGTLLIFMILIECIAGTVISMASGMLASALLAFIATQAPEAASEKEPLILQPQKQLI